MNGFKNGTPVFTVNKQKSWRFRTIEALWFIILVFHCYCLWFFSRRQLQQPYLYILRAFDFIFHLSFCTVQMHRLNEYNYKKGLIIKMNNYN